MSWEIRQGDALDVLRAMPSESVQCCVTSPPYYGLRVYAGAGDAEIGREATVQEYVAAARGRVRGSAAGAASQTARYG